MLACVANFADAPHPDYRLGLPLTGRWREVLNTDAETYGGSGIGNHGAIEAEQGEWQRRPASAVLQLPPSGVLWLTPAREHPAIATGRRERRPAQHTEASAFPPTGTATSAEDVAADPAPRPNTSDGSRRGL